ncbi:CidA/LrgA family protein [Paenibacillus selenitireducens]|uniref:CidA/LrgA family protein n=1 Tax=Paenibacillus selenitireducens TaxID=1324314 RepID=A0A1T2XAP6_9BACL|nr:CidA/LrgA family protein [Paenibacillus selenitireducens]OPA76910.1 CidA/LrgA family protein [Paenibacillus selenitireducens]
MLGFAILLGFQFLGMVLHAVLHIPLPANVLGLILFLIALWTRIVKLEWVEHAAEILMNHMLLFFIPYVIGSVALLHVVGPYALPVIISILGSTVVVLWVTGFLTSKLQHKKEA